MDERLFLRLPQGHGWRTSPAVDVAKRIESEVNLAPGGLKLVHPIPSGFALLPRDEEARQALLRPGLQWKIEAPTQWHRYVAQKVPRMLAGLEGLREVTKDIMKEEITYRTSARVLRCSPSHHRQELPELDWVIVTDKPIPSISLFGSGLIRPMNESPIPLCQICLGYHPRRTCLRPPRCHKCGRGGHNQETCNRPEQCANCLGPHASGASFCPARPKRTQEGVFQLPSSSNRKAIRDLGERSFQRR